MKKPKTTYRLSCADALQHVPEHPERTARRDGDDMGDIYGVWDTPDAMRSVCDQQASTLTYPFRGQWLPWCSTAAALRLRPDLYRSR